MNGSVRRALLFFVALVAIGALLYGARDSISLKGFSWQSLGEAVRHARIGLLLLAMAAIYACYWIRAVRWVRFCRYLGPASIWTVYQATLMGFVAIVLLGRPGEPVRPLLIAKRENLPITGMFGIYVVERIFDIAVTVLVAGASLIYLPELLRRTAEANPSSTASSMLPALQHGGFLLFAGLLAAILFLVYLRVTDGGALARAAARWRDQGGWRTKAAGMVSGFLQGLQAIRTWGDLAAAVGLTAVHWVFIVLIYQWIMASFGGKLAALSIRDAMLVLACAMLGSLLQLPVVGGGAQVGSFLALTVFLNVDQSAAIVAAATLWLVTFASCTIVGIPLLLREGMSIGELRRIATERAPATAGAAPGTAGAGAAPAPAGGAKGMPR